MPDCTKRHRHYPHRSLDIFLVCSTIPSTIRSFLELLLYQNHSVLSRHLIRPIFKSQIFKNKFPLVVSHHTSFSHWSPGKHSPHSCWMQNARFLHRDACCTIINRQMNVRIKTVEPSTTQVTFVKVESASPSLTDWGC